MYFGTEISLRRLARRLQPDVAVVVDSPELLTPLRRRLRRGRLYLDVHTTTAVGLSYLQDLSLSGLDGILAPTRYSAGLVRERRPDTAPVVVPNLVGADPVPADQEGERREAGIPEFVWVGKLDSHKNWRMALVWGRILRDMLGDFRLTVIGGYTAPDKRVEEFLRFADELELEGVLRWIDRIENTRVPAIYRAAAASGGGMLVTSRDESVGDGDR